MTSHSALPTASSNRIGWPWSECVRLEPACTKFQSQWPRITVVTPSFNQAGFLEETIRSVLLQGYPNLEYIVIDGGSTDGSVEIIRKYATHLAHWESTPDRGQSHAINKGFARGTGEIFAWLNSDDAYLPNALAAVAEAYVTASSPAVITVRVAHREDRNGQLELLEVVSQESLSLTRLVRFWEYPSSFSQPGLFFPAHAWRSVGGLNEDLHYALDYDLLCRILTVAAVVHAPVMGAQYRLHDTSKTATQGVRMLAETLAVSRAHWSLVGQIDLRSRRTLAHHLMRQFGTEVLAGRIVSAATALRLALSVDAALTIESACVQLVSGLIRQARQKLAATDSCASSR